jgi:hypothetical protein
MCVIWHIYGMTAIKESPAAVERWFREQVAGRWPAALGSLSLRRSPCIRDKCHACGTGEQHPSYVLYGRRAGRRFAIYVPDALVPEVRRALENGRALQQLLVEAGPRYVRALKAARGRTQR